MKKINKPSILILLFLGVAIIFPLIKMLVNVDWGNFTQLIQSESFKEAMFNSLFTTTISTLISIFIAYLLAYALNRTNIKHKEILKILITIPMFIPSISHGLGLINLFGANGIVSSFFDFNIIGPIGIIMGSVLYSFPIAFIMIDDGFKYIDSNLYNAAKVLGLNKWQIFKKVTFCYLKRTLLSTLFAVFTLIFTDYGVPLAVGGNFNTLPVYLYKEVIGLLDYSTGMMIGIFLLIPAFISFVFDNITKDYTSGDFEGNKYLIKNHKIKDILLKIFVYAIIIIILIIIGSFLYYAFIDNAVLNPIFSLKHFEYVFENNITTYIFNSLTISIFVAIIGTIITYTAAYITSRTKNKLSKLIHFFTILSLTVPGIVLGISFSVTFSGTFIYNTFIILIIVNIIHFMASPYLMARNALKKVNPNYEIIAKTNDISTLRLLKDVILPCTKTTIREMIAYFFVNSMITISAVTFLFNTRTMPLSLLINYYEGNMMLGEAAIISLIILIFNLILKGSIYWINRKEKKERML